RSLAERHGTVGVCTPFRAHTDAIEARLISEFGLDEIRRMGLRSGTVHAFQGTERDAVIVSLALGPDELAGQSLRFVQEPDLFNVMITRARRHITVVHSFDPALVPDGVLADYLRWAADAPSSAPPAGPSPAVPSAGLDPARLGWAGELGAALASLEVRVVPDYAVAGWSVDLAVGEGDAAIGVLTGVHPDGTDAHLRRHLDLRRAGWDLVDIFASQWLLRPEQAAAELAGRVVRRGGDASVA
ncbi:MAG: hypothetical protein KDB21_02010, partial [Acidimicrobiales bacterium]|nr:hypothetical protein [Acidimicrobiales bacterium]